jgi:hypothetical protein
MISTSPPWTHTGTARVTVLALVPVAADYVSCDDPSIRFDAEDADAFELYADHILDLEFTRYRLRPTSSAAKHPER